LKKAIQINPFSVHNITEESMRSVRLSLSIFVMGFLCATTAFSQWTAPWEYFRNTPIPINDFGTATSTITIPDNFNVDDITVMVNIDHTKASDLRITLKDPSGIVYVLSDHNGGSDLINGFPYPDYRYTVFDNNPVSPYGAGLPGTDINDPANNSPLFRGIYKPESILPTNINGAGSWTLEVSDDLIGDTGFLRNWGLVFNRYDFYKDVRIGAAMDLFGFDRYPTNSMMIDDFTTIPPYSVHGSRPEANLVIGAFVVQNSKTASATALQRSYTNPMGQTIMQPNVDENLNVGVYTSPLSINIAQKGTYTAHMNVAQRGDLYQSRGDNKLSEQVAVTPGSLAFDNGVASPITDISAFQGECNGATYTIFADQMLTSVDIWQSDGVELEPFPTPGYASIRVYDNAFTLLHTFGPYDLPKQGNKWVSYAIPPTMLTAGSYTIAVCVDNVPFMGSTGFGVDLLASPFATGGFFQRYFDHGLQWFSLDDGNSWVEEFDASYGTKMIRPNFIFNHSDIGVICFESPTGTLGNTFTPIVTFGSFAHNPHLPNLLTVGSVSVIDNATGMTVAYTEKRMFFGPANWETTVTFDPITGLPAGDYTLRAEVWRSDDENDINNVYERSYTKPAGPVSVVFNSKVSPSKREEIRARLVEEGLEVEMIDRTFGFEFPESGQVVWAGEISSTESELVRSFVEAGNYFAVVPNVDARQGDFRTELFTKIANNEELNTLELKIQHAETAKAPARGISAHEYFENGGQFATFGKDESNEVMDSRVMEYAANMSQRLALAIDPELHPEVKREIVHRGSANIGVKGTRIGDLNVAQIVSNTRVDAQPDVVIAINENDFDISQNYPNPFNPTTTINYNITTDAQIAIRVFDMLGREVATLVNTIQSNGVHTIVWDATDNTGALVSSGLYMYRMEATPLDGSGASVMSKMMILKK
jgi:subtilisin-like proprotein convertase family protein